MKYIEPVGVLGPANAYGHDYVDKNAGAGQAGSFVAADAIEHPMLELVNLISKSGYTPSEGDLQQVARAFRSQALNYVAATGGTANALTVTLDPAPTDHRAGLILRLYPSATNTGAVTLNEGAGALPLRYVTGADLFPGEIVPGRAVEVLCLGGVWVLLNPVEYFERLTPKRARQTSAFTPNVVLSDISGVDTANIVQSVTITGATYIDVTAYLAIRNTVSSLVNVIAYTRLQRSGYPDQDSQYLGCQSANNIQIPMTIRTIYRNLDPTATYALRLIAQKGAAVGPVGVLDTYINATSD